MSTILRVTGLWCGVAVMSTLMACFDPGPAASAALDGRVVCASDADCGSGVCTAGRCLPAGRRAPAVLEPASLRVTEDQALTVNLTVDGDAASTVVELLVAPEHGGVVIDGLNLTYTPAPDYFGPDALEVVVSDTSVLVAGQSPLRSAPHRLTVEVVGVPDDFSVSAPPVVVEEDGEAPVVVDVIDPEAGDCATVVSSQPARGVIDASLRFRPAPDAFGEDQATLVTTCVREGGAASQTVVVDLRVTPVDDLPIPLDAGPLLVDEDDFIPVALPHREVDGDRVCFVIEDEPVDGELNTRELAAGLVVYRPDPDVFGQDGFSFAVGDIVDDVCVPTGERGVVVIDVVGRPDPARIDVGSVTVSVVGQNQFIPVPLSSLDEVANGESSLPTLELGPGSARNPLGTFRASNDERGPGLLFSPEANLTLTEGIVEVRTRLRGLDGPTTILRVRVTGARSCAVAKLLDPSAPSGPLLLLPSTGASAYVAHCEQVRRGGGFELLLKINGQTPTFRFDAPLWTNSALLNPSNIAFDNGDAKLRGATVLRIDDLMIGIPESGITPGVFADVTVPGSGPRMVLTELVEQRVPAPHWETPAWSGITPLPSTQPSCRTGLPSAVFELGVSPTFGVRIGGERLTLCDGVPQPASRATFGVGLLDNSASGNGGQVVLGRSRDFSSLPSAASCAEQRVRYGGAFLPGRYLVGGTVTDCSDDDAQILRRRCGDGAVDNASVEGCDDGDEIDENLCSNSCRTAVCGDLFVQAPEECDPPDATCVPGDACTASCASNCRLLAIQD